MSLPSRYAPDGLSLAEQKKVITVGSSKRQGAEYTFRRLGKNEDTGKDNNADGDESSKENEQVSVPMDIDEVDFIKQYVIDRRNSISGEIDSNDLIDIDMEDALLGLQPNNNCTGGLSILVIDTNFILSHLSVLDELKRKASIFKIVMIVPITVMHELDGLKHSTRIPEQDGTITREVSVGKLARMANDWIYASLAEKSPFVKGQKVYQKLDRETKNDDAILDCCLYFQQNYHGSLVVLLSNDKNLCMRALANEMLTVSFRPHMTADLIGRTIREENERRPNSFLRTSNADSEIVDNSATANILKGNTSLSKTTLEYSFHDGVNIVYNEITTLIISVTKHVMESNFGEELELIRDYKPNAIRSLTDCVHIMIEYWIAAFSFYFKNKKEKPFAEVHRNKRKPIFVEQPSNKIELNDFVAFWSTILQDIYIIEMNKDQNRALELLKERWFHISHNIS